MKPMRPGAGVVVRTVRIPVEGSVVRMLEGEGAGGGSRFRPHSIPALVLSPAGGAHDAPGVLWIHGGGYFLGMKEMVYISRAHELVTQFGAVVVAPGYRMAPWSPYPAAVDDCYAALCWLAARAGELDVRPDQLMVGGESAGGGLAAAVCLAARDAGEVAVAFQMPLYPMLDNLDTLTSAHNRGRVWNTRRNHLGWRLYLRGSARSADASPYAAPARATNLAGLPSAYTFVCTGEPFYAETLAYVDALRAAGVPAEVDVYPGDMHAFDMLDPDAEVSRRAARRFNEAFARAVAHCRAPQP